jgi:hypothetical protein
MLKWCAFATILLAFAKIWLPIPWLAVFIPLLAWIVLFVIVLILSFFGVAILAVAASKK